MKTCRGGRFAVYQLIPCGSCAACQDGQYQLCSDYDYYGSRRDGAFASYLAVKKWNLIPLPEGVSFEAAALCEPCAVAIHALRQGGLLTSGTGDRADGMPGDRGKKVAIFGAGTIGILAAMIAESHQISAVLFDVDQRKLDFAASLGFSHCVNSREAAPDQTFRRIHGGGADVVLDAAGVSSAVEDALLTAKTGGCVVLMGNPAGDIHIGQKKYWEILRKQLTLRGTWNSSFDPQRSDRMRNDWTCALDLMRPAGGKRTPADAGDARLYNVEKLITHRFAFSACEEAFRLAADPGQFSVNVMFDNE